jgi:hypothetical protein
MKMKAGLWMVAAGVVLAAITLVPAWGQDRDSTVVPAANQAGAAVPGAAKEAVANPLYAPWKGQEGKTVTFNRTIQQYGGAPNPGGKEAPPPASNPVQFTLSQFTPDQAVIKFANPKAPDESVTLIVPAKLMPDDPALPKADGAEELKIGDKTYACTKYTYQTKSKAELGEEVYGMSGRITVWVADGVPGGIVKRQISVTYRVTHITTDTLAP